MPGAGDIVLYEGLGPLCRLLRWGNTDLTFGVGLHVTTAKQCASTRPYVGLCNKSVRQLACLALKKQARIRWYMQFESQMYWRCNQWAKPRPNLVMQ